MTPYLSPETFSVSCHTDVYYVSVTQSSLFSSSSVLFHFTGLYTVKYFIHVESLSKFQLTLLSNNPLQYSCLEIPWTKEPGGLLSMGSHRVGHYWSNLTCLHALEKEMATHSSIVAWRIPGIEEPGGLPSVGSHRVGHD